MGATIKDFDPDEILRSDEDVESPDGTLKITFAEMGNSVDQTIRAKLLDAEDNRFVASLGKAQFGAFSADSSLILTVAPDGRARLFNRRGHLLRRFKQPEEVHAAEFIEDNGALLLVFNESITWALRGLGTKLLTGHQAPVLRVEYGLSAEVEPVILTSTQGPRVRLWDALNGRLLAEVHHPPPNLQFNTTFARLSPCGTYFATWSDITGEDGYPKTTVSVKEAKVRLWDLDGNPIAELMHPRMIASLLISPDGQRLITFLDAAGLWIWNKQGELIQEGDGGASYVFNAAFIPGRKLFLVAELRRKQSEVWDLNGKLVRHFSWPQIDIGGKKHTAHTAYPVFSPDGQYLLSYELVSKSKLVFLWNFEDQRVLQVLEHEEKVYSAVFFPRAEQPLILTAAANGRAHLWNFEGKHLRSFAHEGPVYSAAFSPDGEFIVTASADGTAKFWDLEGHLLADLDRHAGEVFSAAFSSSGRYICTGSEDGTARLWPTPHTIRYWMNGPG